jgi:hypothetical protein
MKQGEEVDELRGKAKDLKLRGKIKVSQQDVRKSFSRIW